MKGFPRMARATLKPTVENSDFTESVDDIAYSDTLSNHRSMLPIYDLTPASDATYVAPSATVTGEVYIDSYASIWNNVVIRGDLNAVTIGAYTSVGDNTVISTVASLPTGIEASANIGRNVTINSDCTLSSCTIEPDVVVGAKSVI